MKSSATQRTMSIEILIYISIEIKRKNKTNFKLGEVV